MAKKYLEATKMSRASHQSLDIAPSQQRHLAFGLFVYEAIVTLSLPLWFWASSPFSSLSVQLPGLCLVCRERLTS